MKIYRIDGWDKGVKVRIDFWGKDEYVYYHSNSLKFYDENNKPADETVTRYIASNNWELYEETVKPKTLPLYATINGVKVSTRVGEKVMFYDNNRRTDGYKNIVSAIINLQCSFRQYCGEEVTEIVSETK